MKSGIFPRKLPTVPTNANCPLKIVNIANSPVKIRTGLMKTTIFPIEIACGKLVGPGPSTHAAFHHCALGHLGPRLHYSLHTDPAAGWHGRCGFSDGEVGTSISSKKLQFHDGL